MNISKKHFKIFILLFVTATLTVLYFCLYFFSNEPVFFELKYEDWEGNVINVIYDLDVKIIPLTNRYIITGYLYFDNFPFGDDNSAVSIPWDTQFVRKDKIFYESGDPMGIINNVNIKSKYTALLLLSPNYILKLECLADIPYESIMIITEEGKEGSHELSVLH